MEKTNDENVKLNPWNLNNKLITEDYIKNFFKTYDIDIEINDLSLFQRAFVHKSYIKKEQNICNGKEVEIEEQPDNCLDLQPLSYERFEYLGDAILSATIASYLFERFPNEEEGFLTRMRTKLVCGDMLGSLGLKMDLSEYVIMSRHVEDRCNGRTSVKIMEDIFEALIGALYLDVNYDDEELEHPSGKLELYSGYGFHICQTYIINVIEKLVDFSDLILNDYNYKDKLMKYFQQNFKEIPKYKEILVEGPSNDRYFTMCVTKNDESILAYGKERTKKKAEQLASKNALIKLGIIEA